MSRDAEKEAANKAILEQIQQLKAEISGSPETGFLHGAWRIFCGIVGALVLLIVLIVFTTSSYKKDNQAPAILEAKTNESEEPAQPSKIIAARFDQLIAEFTSNEVAASRKYDGSRIRTKDYVTSIQQDSEGAYAVLDGGIYAYGSADILATMHRGDEVQVTCNKASKMTFLYIRGCEFEVLHPAGGFDEEIGDLAVYRDGNGGAALALVRREDGPNTAVVPTQGSQAPSPN